MLFSRKNAAIVAAFLAPSAYAQTASVAAQSPGSCQAANTATFLIGARGAAQQTQNNPPAAVGDLMLQVVVNTDNICQTANTGTSVGYRVTTLNGTLGNAGNTGTPNQVTYLPAGTGSDGCFFPCNTGQYVDNLGISFSTNNGGQSYRLSNTGPSAYQLNPTTNPQGATSLSQNIIITNACKSPSSGSAFCDVTQSCNGGNRGFSTFVGQTNDGVPFTANVGYNPAVPCTQTPAAAGTTNPQGFAVTTISGNVNGAPIEMVPSGVNSYCFYPCSTGVVDFQGVQFRTFNTIENTFTPVSYTFSYVPAGSNTVATYRLATAGGATTGATGTTAQSCNPNQVDFRNCAASSSSSLALPTSSASSIISGLPSISVSVPSVLPTIASSSAAAPVSSAVVISTASGTAALSSASVAPVSSVVIVTTGSAASAPASASVTSRPTSAAATTTVAAITGPQTSLPTPFVITINVRVTRKRQAVQYVGDGGVLTTDPTAAAIFQLINGQLFSDGAIVSTGPTIPAQQPLDGGAQGTVTTLWTSTAGSIAWTNAVFANGAATFCVANNIVNTVFVAAPAAGCVPVALTGVAASAVIPANPSVIPGAGGITINNNFNPTIGVMVTVNLVLGTSTLGNGSVITTTGLSSTTSPLYATASGNAYCLPCHMSAVGAACPNSGNVVYTTACGACAAYTAAPAAVVTCGTCAPIALPAATAAPVAPVAPGAPAGTAGAAPAAAGSNTFTGGAVAFGVSAAAVMVAGAALLL